MLKFIKNLKRKSLRKLPSNNNVNTITLSDGEIVKAKEYFSGKATLEVKKFIKPTQYQKTSIERDNILCYRGRILQDNWWNVYSNERLCSKHNMCINQIQAFTFGIQFNQLNAMTFKGSDVFWCWDSEEICTKDCIDS